MSVNFLVKKKELSCPSSDQPMIFLLLQFMLRLCLPHGHPLVSQQRSEFWRLPTFFLDISHPTPIKDMGLVPSICPVRRKCITPGKNEKQLKSADYCTVTKTWKTHTFIHLQSCVQSRLNNIWIWYFKRKWAFIWPSFALLKRKSVDEGNRVCC